jgi:hypothetical protein
MTPAGGSFNDSGTGSCHGAPPPPLPYRDGVLASSPAAYWRFGDTSGTTATDELGADPGTYSNVTLGQPSALAGDSDPSAAFDGTNSYVTVPAASALNLTSGATVEFWAKRAAVSSDYQVILGKPADGASQNQNYAVWLTPSNRYTAYFGNGGTYVAVQTPAITDTNWHYVVATDNGSTAKIYLDGVLKQTVTTTVALTANNGALSIGRSNVDNNFYFNGLLDEVAIYPTALSATTVSNHYVAATTP